MRHFSLDYGEWCLGGDGDDWVVVRQVTSILVSQRRANVQRKHCFALLTTNKPNEAAIAHGFDDDDSSASICGAEVAFQKAMQVTL